MSALDMALRRLQELKERERVRALVVIERCPDGTFVEHSSAGTRQLPRPEPQPRQEASDGDSGPATAPGGQDAVGSGDRAPGANVAPQASAGSDADYIWSRCPRCKMRTLKRTRGFLIGRCEHCGAGG